MWNSDADHALAYNRLLRVFMDKSLVYPGVGPDGANATPPGYEKKNRKCPTLGTVNMSKFSAVAPQGGDGHCWN